jgi:hypothetical protein
VAPQNAVAVVLELANRPFNGWIDIIIRQGCLDVERAAVPSRRRTVGKLFEGRAKTLATNTWLEA